MFDVSMLPLNLQCFADGGDGASEGSAPAAAGQGEGGDAAVAVSEGLAAAPSSAPLTEQQREEMFRALIKGEYKDLYEREIRRLLQNRFRHSDARLRRLETLSPLLDRLCARFGVEQGDVEGLCRALDAEDAQEAKLRPVEGHSEAADTDGEADKQDDAAEAIVAAWLSQAEALRETVPDFDFSRESANEDFARLLAAGLPVETAYEIVHRDELLESGMRYAARETERRLLGALAARGARPGENALSPNGAALVKSDPRSMTKAERREIARRAMRGEKITF
jgi:hypothetical protein